MIIKYFGLAKQNIFSYLKSASSSTSRAFFFIILRNSGKSMVPWILDNFEQSVCFSYLPFPSTSTSSTKLRSSSSVGFCPIALMTPSSSSEEIVPLPSWNNFFSMIISQRQAQQLLIPTYTCYTSLFDRVPLTLSNASNASFSSAFSKLAKSEDIIAPSYLSASPDEVEVERNSELSLLKQNCLVGCKI